MHCGAAVLAAAPGHSDAQTSMPTAFEEAHAKHRRSMRWLAVLGILGAFVAALVGLQLSGALAVTGEQNAQPVLQATGALQAPELLRAEGNAGRPVLERAGSRVVMPDDIRNWLEHLRITEERRMRLAEEQINQALPFAAAGMAGLSGIEALFGDLDDPPVTVPEQLSNKSREGVVQGIRKSWGELTVFFNSVPPPVECVSIRNNYDQVVRETGNLTGEILEAITSPDTAAALSKVQDIRRRNKTLIDEPAIEADALVAELCRRYNTRKWFEIKGDVEGGTMGKNGIF